MDEERNEDLNPRSNDIEERVKQMLDLSVPDTSETAKADVLKPAGKTIKVQAISTPAGQPTDPLSAPELPTAKTTPKNKTASKKVIMPTSHDQPDAAKEPGKKVKEADAPSPIKKITINDSSETPADIAEKLDEAIAGLDSINTEPMTPSTEPQADITSDPETDKETPSLPATDEESEIPVQDPPVVADPETDKAVEAIVAEESDKLLEMEDIVRDTDEPIKPEKPPRRRQGLALKSWLSKPLFRRGLLLLIGLGLLAACLAPASRYFLLNTVGVRSSSSLTVLDDSTQQPLKNVQVKIGDVQASTDVDGKVKLTKIPLGKTQISIEKRAFAPIHKAIVLGWGSNPLGDFKLTPTGTQYSFNVTDFLSGKPVSKVEATSNDASAVSDEKGDIRLTIDRPDADTLNVSLKGGDYRDEQLSLNPDDKAPHPIKLVPARKQLFISKRSGKYDIYSIYIDGKDEKVVLAGSGKERDDMVLVQHPSANIAAYVSTRGNQTNSDGYLLTNLILINTEDNSTTNIGASERMQIVSWSSDYLIYVQITAGASANSPKRYKLMSYNYKDQSSKELASSNFFNDVVYAGGAIYYAPSGANQTGQASFYKINPDGSGGQVVLNKEVWNVFRTAYDHFALSVQQQWYDYHVASGSQPTKLGSAPSDQTTRVYIDSPDGKRSAWIDNRDGKGVLLIYDIAAKSDTTLHSQSGLIYPVQWLNDKVLVYRVKSPTETADYAISTDGGEPVKIRDVTNTRGIDRWYYY